MILFKEDWARFPSAIPHLTTKNKSWIQLAHVYREMGIDNYYFHLSLLNPALEHVDPYDPDLDDDTRDLILTELQWNPWYYFREFTRVPSRGGGPPMYFNANRGNVAFIWAVLCNVTAALMMVRQFGKTTAAEQLAEWVLDYGTRNAEIYWITRSSGLRDKTINNIKVSRSLKPKWADLTTRDDSDNMVSLTRKALNNHLKMAPASGSRIGAEALGRGHSASLAILDEVAFLTFLRDILGALLPSVTEAGRQSKAAGRPHGIGMVSTAGDLTDRDGGYYHSVIYGGLQWDESLMDLKDKDALRDEVNARSSGSLALINIVLNHRQLGKTDEWLMENIRTSGGTDDDIKKNWFNTWGSGGIDNPLTIHVQDAIADSEVKPLWSERVNGFRNYVIRWYKEEHELMRWFEDNTMVMGMDTSNAVGRDSITLVGVCPKTLETIMAFNINEANVYNFANFLGKFMIRYPKTVLVPENKLNAKTILDTLLVLLTRENINPYTRIYNETVQNGASDRDEFNRVVRLRRLSLEEIETVGNQFGYKTAGSGNRSRDILYDSALSLAASRACKLIKDPNLISELLGLREKNGRIDHQAGGTDDHVVSWLLCNWLLNQGKNLDVYGIHGALSRVTELDVHNDISEQDHQAKILNESLRDELETLVDLLSSERNMVKRKRMEIRIRQIDRQLSSEYHTWDSIDQLLRESRNKSLGRIRDRAG